MRGWGGSDRAKIDRLLSAGYAGFCGGDGGFAGDYVDKLDRIDARAFAWCVLTAEGMAETFEYDTTWRPYFEKMFRDVFGDREVVLRTPVED